MLKKLIRKIKGKKVDAGIELDDIPEIDVIITWPSGMDYPIWRWYISHIKKYFNKVIVVFYSHGKLDFTDFIPQAMPDTHFLVSKISGVNWREEAVSTALNYSEADWVWFTEQDFLFKADYCFERIFAEMKNADVIGIKHGNRYHPCSMFVKREAIEKTNKDFSAPARDFDHFSMFSKELKKFAEITTFEDLALFRDQDWYHMSSLTWNYWRIMDNELEDMHEPCNWLVWNKLSRETAVPQSEKYLALSRFGEQRLSSLARFLKKE